jgi:hypothetical protein
MIRLQQIADNFCSRKTDGLWLKPLQNNKIKAEAG